MTLVSILIYALLLSAGPVHAQKIGICERMFSAFAGTKITVTNSPIDKVRTQLGYLPVIVDGSDARQKVVFIQLMHPELSTELARLTGELHDGGSTLSIDNIDVVNENNQRKGLSELLLGEALKHFPGIRRINSTMSLDNLRVLKKALNSGLDCEAAMRTTPAYKIRARFGFTKFTKPPLCLADEFVYYFEVERPG